MTAFLKEVLEILKPDAIFASLNLSNQVDDVEDVIRKAGFVDVKTVQEAFYMAPLPSRLTLARTPPADVQIHFRDKGDSVSRRQDGGGASAGNYSRALGVSTFLVWAGLYAAFLIATPRVWCDAQVPSDIPWSNQLISILVNTISSMPVIGYFSLGTLRSHAREFVKKKKFNDGTIIYECLGLRRMVPALAAFLILCQVVGSMLFGLLIYSFVLWLPTFVLDVALHGSVSDSTISALNVAVNVLIFYILARKVPGWYSAWVRRKQQAEQLKLQQLQQQLQQNEYSLHLEEPLFDD